MVKVKGTLMQCAEAPTSPRLRRRGGTTVIADSRASPWMREADLEEGGLSGQGTKRDKG